MVYGTNHIVCGHCPTWVLKTPWYRYRNTNTSQKSSKLRPPSAQPVGRLPTAEGRERRLPTALDNGNAGRIHPQPTDVPIRRVRDTLHRLGAKDVCTAIISRL